MPGCGACGSSWKQPKAMIPAYSRGGGLGGQYMLAGFEDCAQLYQGPLAGGAVFAVATATPDQRLFRWEDYEAAQAYAEQLNLTQIDSVPVTSICQQAIDDLYA